MAEDNKVVIELEIQIRKLQEDLKKAKKEITGFSKSTEKGGKAAGKTYEDLVDKLKEVAKAHKESAKEAQKAARAQEQAAKKRNTALEKTLSVLGKIKNISKEVAKYDVGKGFFGGLARGTGIAGVYGSMREGNRRQRLGGAIGRGVVGGASALGGFFMGGLQSGYGQYMQRGIAMHGMTGLGTRGEYARRRSFGVSGGRLGFTGTETAGMAPGAAAATGQLSSVALAQQLAIGGGFGAGRVGEAVGFMGTMRQAGDRFSTKGEVKARQRDLGKIVAAGMASGLEKARLPEFFGSVRGLVQSRFETAAGRVDSMGITKLLAQMGKQGGVGFQGERGGRVMGRLDAMVRRPGGGEAGQAMVLQAMGFGKPGGGRSYYEALKMQQKGIVGDPQNLQRVMSEVYKQHGDMTAGGKDPRNQQANLVLSTMSGLSLEIVEELKDIYSSNKSADEKTKEIEKTLKKAEPIDKQALAATKKGFSGVKQHLAHIEDMQVHLGSKIAPTMMKMQVLQNKILLDLAKGIPAILHALQEIYKLIVTAIGWLKTDLSPDAAWDAVKKRIEGTEEAIMNKKTRGLSEMIKKNEEIMEFTNKRKDAAKKAYGGSSLLDMIAPAAGLFGGARRGGNVRNLRETKMAVAVANAKARRDFGLQAVERLRQEKVDKRWVPGGLIQAAGNIAEGTNEKAKKKMLDAMVAAAKENKKRGFVPGDYDKQRQQLKTIEARVDSIKLPEFLRKPGPESGETRRRVSPSPTRRKGRRNPPEVTKPR